MSDPKLQLWLYRGNVSILNLLSETLYEHTDLPFKLVYVDGNHLVTSNTILVQAKQRFHLIRTEHFL